MPTKLKVLLALLAISILANLAAGLAGSVAGWVSVLVNGILFVGVLKGKEGARNILMGLAVLGFFGAAFALLVGFLSLAAEPTLGIVAISVGGFSAFQNGYCLWCLRQWDVQRWMFNRSLGPMGA